MKLPKICRNFLDKMKNYYFRRRFTREDQKLVKHRPEFLPFVGLHQDALALAQIRVDSRTKVRYVNIIFPNVSSSSLFAGVMTGVRFAINLSRILGVPLRIIAFRGLETEKDKQEVRNTLKASLGNHNIDAVLLTNRRELKLLEISTKDFWIATYWTTAFAVSVACKTGLIDPGRVTYLVQDYEPSFYAASTDSTLARSTYDQGFHHVVNSKPLADYLSRICDVAVYDDLVFAPEIDFESIIKSRTKRSNGRIVRIAFYGRPSKPRNMFMLGISALRTAVRQLETDGIEFTVVSVGEKHADQRLSNECVLASRGKLTWIEYFDFLASTDILLSLQATPHPSHPPMDMVLSGGISVTNDIGETRSQIHENLIAIDPNPDKLADGIVAATRKFLAKDGSEFLDKSFISTLGNELDDVIVALVNRLIHAR